MDYLIKSSAILGMFYVLYILWLQKETFFNYNRWFLLFGLLTSIILPLIVIPIYVEREPTAINFSQFTTSTTTYKDTPRFSWLDFAIGLYGLGVIFFLIRFIIECISLKSFMSSQHIQRINGFKISETQQDIPPFSFFKTIVYNPDQFTTTERKYILNHEKVHAKDYHSIDIIIIKLTTIIFWCNPIVWLYKKALIQNLEFIADHKAIQHELKPSNYQNLLLKTSVSPHQMALTTNFYNSLIKKRILMLNRSNSKSIYALKYLVILPALAFFMMSFNTKMVYRTVLQDTISGAINNIEIQGVITNSSKDEDLNNLIEVFAKQEVELKIKQVKRNTENQIVSIAINAKHKDSKVQYQASTNSPISPIQIIFNSDTKELAISKAETNSEIVFTSSKNADKVNSGFIVNTSDGGSINLKRLSEDTTDKNVMFISEDGKTTHITTDNNGEQQTKTFDIKETTFTDENEKTTDTVPFTQGKPEPLLILNGQEITKAEMNALDPDSIDSIFVLKGDQAIAKYNDKGKDGVVEIILKKDSDYTKTAVQSSDVKVVGYAKENPPLIIINGEEQVGTSIDDINPDTIKSINVLKGESATTKYGDKAKDGAIEITLKK